LLDYHRKKMMPALTRAMLRHHGFRTYYYGNFATEDSLTRQAIFPGNPKGDPQRPTIWRTFSPQPRLGFNYVGLRNRLSILSEAFSYLDFRRRVAVTTAFVAEILGYSAAHAAEIRRVTHQADARTIALGRNDKERRIGVDYTPKALAKPVTILVGEVVQRTNALSGAEMTVMVEDAVTPVKMMDYGLFAASRSVPIARAYFIPGQEGMRAIVENLQAHGVLVEEVAKPLTIEIEAFTIERVMRAPYRFQGHENIKVTGRYDKKKMRFEAGTYLVRTSQPLGVLAACLLEPESDDGLLAWNFLDAFLEPQKVFPVYKLMRSQQ
jgi:hypothetical protein